MARAICPASFSQLFVIPADGGAARQLTHGDFDARRARRPSCRTARACLRSPRTGGPDADFEPHRQRNLPRGPRGRIAPCADRPTRARPEPGAVPGRQAHRLPRLRRQAPRVSGDAAVRDGQRRRPPAFADACARSRCRIPALDRRRQEDRVRIHRPRTTGVLASVDLHGNIRVLASGVGGERRHASVHRRLVLHGRQRAFCLHPGLAPRRRRRLPRARRSAIMATV